MPMRSRARLKAARNQYLLTPMVQEQSAYLSRRRVPAPVLAYGKQVAAMQRSLWLAAMSSTCNHLFQLLVLWKGAQDVGRRLICRPCARMTSRLRLQALSPIRRNRLDRGYMRVPETPQQSAPSPPTLPPLLPLQSAPPDKRLQRPHQRRLLEQEAASLLCRCLRVIHSKTRLLLRFQGGGRQRARPPNGRARAMGLLLFPGKKQSKLVRKSSGTRSRSAELRGQVALSNKPTSRTCWLTAFRFESSLANCHVAECSSDRIYIYVGGC